MTTRERYFFFNGEINPLSAHLITTRMGVVANDESASGVTILFNSGGGDFGDGIALYGFFASYPKPLTLYNGGFVASAGAIAFLGAPNRFAAPASSFMFHGVRTGYTGKATVNELKGFVARSTEQQKIIDGILKELKPGFNGRERRELQRSELNLSAGAAEERGVVQAPKRLVIPPGSAFPNIGAT